MKLPLTEAHWKSFEEKGYCVVDQSIYGEGLSALQQEALTLMEGGAFKEAGIGRGLELSVIKSERGDVICWLDAENASPAQAHYHQVMEQLRLDLNRNFYLGLRRLESHYALYPIGSRYARHTDRHRNGSPRRVSAVLYLNANWTEADGGQLELETEQGEHVMVWPESGRLVLFLSELMHEVHVTHRPRLAITGWYRTDD